MSQQLFLFNISAVQTMSTAVPLVNAVTQTTTDTVHDDSMQEDERSSDGDDMSVDSDDSQYVPSDEENMSEDDDELSAEESESPDESSHTPPTAEIPTAHKEAKYIVFISSLLHLISMCCCSVCGSKALQTTRKEVGSMLIVYMRCCDCGEERTWHSQPYIGNFCAGNILLSAATLFAGVTVGKIQDCFDAHMNVDICMSVTAVKYLYKNINKGQDQSSSSMQDSCRRRKRVGASSTTRFTTDRHQFTDWSYISQISKRSCIGMGVRLQPWTTSRAPPSQRGSNRTRPTLRPATPCTPLPAEPHIWHANSHLESMQSRQCSRPYLHCISGGRRTLLHAPSANSPDGSDKLHRSAHTCGRPRLCDIQGSWAATRAVWHDYEAWHDCLSDAADFKMPSQLRHLLAIILIFCEHAEPANAVASALTGAVRRPAVCQICQQQHAWGRCHQQCAAGTRAPPTSARQTRKRLRGFSDVAPTRPTASHRPRVHRVHPTRRSSEGWAQQFAFFYSIARAVRAYFMLMHPSMP